MLDDWMGVDRNGDFESDVVTSYDDPQICKYSLAGCCPYRLLLHTRTQRGPCRFKICPAPQPLREQYMRDREGMPTQYDQMLYDILESIINHADNQIRFSKAQRDQQAAKSQIRPELQQKDAQILDLINKAREAGLRDEVNTARAYLEQAEKLKEQRKKIEHDIQKALRENERRIEVCEVCTAVIKQCDKEGRMDEHNAGRQHQAFKKIRETFETLKAEGVASRSRRTNRAPPSSIRNRIDYGPVPVRQLTELD